ncbi:hypothetical protein TGAM01_v205932 [Trichoderma gamsii]|uniref:Extracellular membrane protein CFEM domain-containing protein n=1 Tax=Trichoderma gamsii TaxID=398673 RepID=A0A2P4ZLS3_9HYPO|nr:hypothetical protein TGAM01_v205932 [Trichoderma gamsii]PON25246.1 hypothetical protein TGAM01_v205932 [Trichoderma gamsii]
MTRHRAMQQLSLANLVFLIGTASGALLTLSSFESLASPAPLSCIYAYNAPIRGCIADDFAKGATCSETCVEGLQAVQFTVRSLCAKVSDANNVLLQQIQTGNLVAAICKTSTPASTPTPPPATTLQTSTVQTSPPSQASPPPQSSSDVASHVTSTQQPVSTEAAPSTTASATPDHSITSAAVSSSAIESATATSQTSVEKPSSSSEEPSKPTRPINPNAQPGSGGGSPFDFVAISTANNNNFVETFTTLAIAAVMAALILI